MLIGINSILEPYVHHRNYMNSKNNKKILASTVSYKQTIRLPYLSQENHANIVHSVINRNLFAQWKIYHYVGRKGKIVCILVQLIELMWPSVRKLWFLFFITRYHSFTIWSGKQRLHVTYSSVNCRLIDT